MQETYRNYARKIYSKRTYNKSRIFRENFNKVRWDLSENASYKLHLKQCAILIRLDQWITNARVHRVPKDFSLTVVLFPEFKISDFLRKLNWIIKIEEIYFFNVNMENTAKFSRLIPLELSFYLRIILLWSICCIWDLLQVKQDFKQIWGRTLFIY